MINSSANSNSSFSLQRDILMGVGIISVILFHMYTALATHDLDCFRLGYLGVDIFIMASGYGLCRSYEKNNLKKFYNRRLLRILPLYVIFVILIQIINIFGNSSFSIRDMLEQLFLISFLKGEMVEWYVPSILILYFAFPLIYKSTEKFDWIVLALVCIFSIAFLSWKQWVLTWNCFVSRIPVFIYGITIYLHEKNGKSLLMPASIILLTTILSHSFGTSEFLSTGTITAFALPYIAQIITNQRFTPPHCKKSKEILRWTGANSYPIYLSNALLIAIFQNIFPSFQNSLFKGISVYLFSAIFLAIIFIGISQLTNKLTSNI